MKILLSILLVTVTVVSARSADIITLTGTNSYTVGANEVAEVISHSGDEFYLNGYAADTVVVHSSGVVVRNLPMVFTGPGVSIKPHPQLYPGRFVTLLIRSKAEYLSTLSSPSFASSTSVVVPEDAAGTVEIVMESSTDLVNWTAASPGTYGSSTARRFFRVRAIQKSP